MSLLEVLDMLHEDLTSKSHTFRSRKVERLRIHHDQTVLERKLGGYGPQGDRTFGATDQADDDGGLQVELDVEPFSDIMEVDGTEERCLDDSDK